MFGRNWTFRAFVKYTLIQLPGIALIVFLLYFVQQWIDLPAWLTWGIIIVWVLKDIILFPFVWRAYDWGPQHNTNTMIGMQGMALERLDPSGYILVRGEQWKAEIIEKTAPVEKGQTVRVERSQGLTLYFKAVDKS